MRDPDLVTRAQRAAVALERAWERWRVMHGLSAEPMPPVSSYVGYSIEEPWGRPRVVFGIDAKEAELLAALLDHHECVGPFYPADPGEAGISGGAGGTGTRLDEARSRIPAQAQAAEQRARDDRPHYEQQPHQRWDTGLPAPVGRPGTGGDPHAGQTEFGDAGPVAKEDGGPASQEKAGDAAAGPLRRDEDRSGAARASDQRRDRRAEMARPSRRERRAASRQRSAGTRERAAEVSRTDATGHAAARAAGRDSGHQAGSGPGGPVGDASGDAEYTPGGAEHVWAGGERISEDAEYTPGDAAYVPGGAEHGWAGGEHPSGDTEPVWAGAEHMSGGTRRVAEPAEHVPGGAEQATGAADPGWLAGAEGMSPAGELATTSRSGRTRRTASSAAVDITTVDSIPVDRGIVDRGSMDRGSIERAPADRDAAGQRAGESATGNSALGWEAASRSATGQDAASDVPGPNVADRTTTDKAVADAAAQRVPRARSLYDVTKARWERAREAARGRGGAPVADPGRAPDLARGSAGEAVRSEQAGGGPVILTGLPDAGQPALRPVDAHPGTGQDYPVPPSSGFEGVASGRGRAEGHWQDTGPGLGYTDDPGLGYADDAGQDYPGDDGWDDATGHHELPVTGNGGLPGPGGEGGRDSGRSDTAGLDQLWDIGRSGAGRGQGQPRAAGTDAVGVDPHGSSAPGTASGSAAPGNPMPGDAPGHSARSGHGSGTTAGAGPSSDTRGAWDGGTVRDASPGTARNSVWAQEGGSAWEASPARDGRENRPGDFDPDPLGVPADRGAVGFLAAPPPSGAILTTAPRQETRTARPAAGSMATETIAAELAGWAAGELPGQASARLAAWAAIGGVPAPGYRRTDGSDVGAAGVGSERVR